MPRGTKTSRKRRKGEEKKKKKKKKEERTYANWQLEIARKKLEQASWKIIKIPRTGPVISANKTHA